MYCIACGKELEDGVAFCRFCGTRQPPFEAAPTPAPETEAAPTSVPEPEPAASPAPAPAPDLGSEPISAAAPAPEPVPTAEPAPAAEPVPAPVSAAPISKKGAPWKIIAAVLAVLAIVGIGAFAFISNRAKQLAETYGQASSLYEEGAFEEAAVLFEELGDYEDAAAMKQTCDQWIAAQNAEADAGEDAAAWEAVAAAYARIDDKRAEEPAEYASDMATYYAAKDLMAQGAWTDAFDLFQPLADKRFLDSLDLALVCGDWYTYEEAMKHLSEGEYAWAYNQFCAVFDQRDGMDDLEAKKQECIQPFPASGVFYRNDAYGGTDARLVIAVMDEPDSILEIFDGETLVLSAYLPSNESVELYLPAGTYRFVQTTGDMWFGEVDQFGDWADEINWTIDGGETFTLQAGDDITMS